jgi:hypothetical protein
LQRIDRDETQSVRAGRRPHTHSGGKGRARSGMDNPCWSANKRSQAQVVL